MNNLDGSYILMASYTDKGTTGAEVLSSQQMLILRNAKISAAGYDEIKVASKHTATTNELKPLGIKEEMNVVLGMAGGNVTYKNIDLTNIGYLKGSIVLNPDFTTGGQILINLDNPDGELIGSFEVSQDISNLGFKTYSASIKKNAGYHDLCFSFKGDGLVGVVFWWEFVPET